jgi:hypothetical protein
VVGKILEHDTYGYGFDAQTGEFVGADRRLMREWRPQLDPRTGPSSKRTSLPARKPSVA